MGFALDSPYVEPYFGGSTILAESTTGLYEAALAGHQFMIDWKSEVPLRYAPVPFTRQQADQSDKPGEATINPEGLWRRSGESWHLGAGQDDFDRKDSNEFRFNTSKGAYVWDKWKWTLLKDTDQKHSSAESNLYLAVAGSRVYYTHGTNIEFITDITADTPTRTPVTGGPATGATSIATNGFRVWTTHGTNGIYMTDRTITTTTSHVTGTVSLVRYVRNRVLAAGGGSIYDVTTLAMGAGGALPAALFTHPNTDFAWVDFAEGNGFIYAAGFSGDKSLIYKITLVAEGTSLGAPSVAAQLPDGELITHIRGYLGNFMYIGTSKGWRLALVTDNGDLRLGALVETPMPVLDSEPQEDFIWYGLGQFDGTSSGLGRLSTNFFTNLDRLVPAYASDLMVDVQANCQAVVTFQGLRVFTLSQSGLYAEHQTRLVPEGHIDTGRITYGMTEPKIGIWFNIQHEEQAGHHSILASYDGSAFQSLGTHTHGDVHSTAQHFVGFVTAASFEFRLVLERDPLDDTSALDFHSWLFRVQPTSEPTDYIYATVLIAEEIEDVNGTPQRMDTNAVLDFLKETRKNRSLSRWQQGKRSDNVILEDFQLNYMSLAQLDAGFLGYNGSCLLKMKVV